MATDKPFFIYWTPGAAHRPYHVFKEWADKYKGKFDDGWDQMRERIFARQKAMGWIPANTQLTPRPSMLASWDSIPDSEKPFQRRLIEVFAGYTEHADTQAGRLIDELERLGLRDNTLIFYVWGDNGSSAEGQNGTISELLAQNQTPTRIDDHIKALDELGGLNALGGPKTDNMYHAGWAWAGSTPFKGTKLLASHFGGTRTPLVVSWPKGIKADKTPRPQFHHVNDIVPTVYEILGITPPRVVDGIPQDPIDGVSMQYTFADANAMGHKLTQYFEIMGSRAIYPDGWTASAFGPRVPWLTVTPGMAEWTPDKDVWELYKLDEDFSQANDLALQHLEKVAAMKEMFAIEATKNLVYPIGGGLWVAFHPDDTPFNPATEFHFTGDIAGMPEPTAPRLGTRSNLVTIDAEIQPDSRGVLYALGGFSAGLALWMKHGKLNYEYNLFEIERTRISTSNPLPIGKVKIEVETRRAGKEMISPFDITLRFNGQEVAKGRVPRGATLGFTANDSFDVGMDRYSPVSLAYFDKAPFKFNGTIHTVDVKYTK